MHNHCLLTYLLYLPAYRRHMHTCTQYISRNRQTGKQAGRYQIRLTLCYVCHLILGSFTAHDMLTLHTLQKRHTYTLHHTAWTCLRTFTLHYMTLRCTVFHYIARRCTARSVTHDKLRKRRARLSTRTAVRTWPCGGLRSRPQSA